VGTVHVQPLSLARITELSSGNSQSQGNDEPARSVTHRREDNNRVRFLTDEEEKNLRNVVRKRWPKHLPEMDLAINTGIRKGSQYGLTWDMVDWKSRELHIPRTKNEEPLHVPLNDAAISALKTVFKKGGWKGTGIHVLEDGRPARKRPSLA
jgi:integrase